MRPPSGVSCPVLLGDEPSARPLRSEPGNSRCARCSNLMPRRLSRPQVMSEQLLLVHDFPPMGGGIARWMGELAGAVHRARSSSRPVSIPAARRPTGCCGVRLTGYPFPRLASGHCRVPGAGLGESRRLLDDSLPSSSGAEISSRRRIPPVGPGCAPEFHMESSSTAAICSSCAGKSSVRCSSAGRRVAWFSRLRFLWRIAPGPQRFVGLCWSNSGLQEMIGFVPSLSVRILWSFVPASIRPTSAGATGWSNAAGSSGGAAHPA